MNTKLAKHYSEAIFHIYHSRQKSQTLNGLSWLSNLTKKLFPGRALEILEEYVVRCPSIKRSLSIP